MAGGGFIASEALEAAALDPVLLRAVLPRVEPELVKVRVAPSWFRAIWGRRIAAVCMAWGVYVRPHIADVHRSGLEPDRIGRLIAHELMHLEQWRRHGPLGHSVRYLGDYVRGRVRGKSHWQSYRAIRLEVEARGAAELLMANRGQQ